MNSHRCIPVFLLTMLVLGTSGTAVGSDLATYLNRVQESSVTDRPAWANPLDGGSIRTLYLAPRYTLRDAVALAHHVQLDLHVVPLWGRNTPGAPPEAPLFKGAALDEVTDAVRKGLSRRPALIIAANTEWASLPAEITESVLDRVASGAGLLLVHAGDAVPSDDLTPTDEAVSLGISAGTGIEHVPGWEFQHDLVETWTYGSGRVVRLAYPEDPPLTHALLPRLEGPAAAHAAYHDVFYSLAARAVCWAAGRESDVRIAGWTYEGPEAPDASEIPPLYPEFIQFMKEQTVHQPSRRYVLELAEPAPGRYRLDTALRHPESGQPPLRIFLPGTESRGTSRYPFFVLAAPGQYFLDFWLKRRDQVAAWHTDVIRLEGWPRFQEVRLNKTTVTPFDAIAIQARMEPRVYRPRPVAVYARAVDAHQRVVAQTRATTTDDTANLVLDLVDLLSNRIKVQVVATEQQGPIDFDRELLFNPGQTFYLPVMRTADEHRLRFGTVWTHGIEPTVRHVFGGLSALGVDTVFAGPDPEAAFYASEAALDVQIHAPPAATDSAHIESYAARLRHNGVRNLWIDTGGIDPSWPAGYAGSVRGALADAGARVDLLARIVSEHETGAWGHADSVLVPFDTPIAYELSARSASYWLAVDAHRAISEPEARWLPWFAVLRGAHGLVYERAYGDAHATALNAALAPDGRPMPVFEVLAESLREVRRGVDALLLGGERFNSGIAILAGSPGQHAPDNTTHVSDWLNLLQAAGYQGAVVTHETLAALGPDDYPVLLLTHEAGLGVETIRAAARFAAMGGVIVAAELPEVADGSHPWAPIFGVTHTHARNSADLALRVDGFETNESPPVHTTVTGVNPALRIVDAVAHGDAEGAPAWIVREAGAAPALLFNHSLTGNSVDLSVIGQTLSGFLEGCGAVASDALDAGRAPFAGEYAVYRFGEATLHVLLREPSGDGRERVQLRLDRKKHVYDVVTGTPVMRPDRIAARLAPGEVALYSELPYGVSTLDLVAPEEVAAGRRIEYRIAIKTVDGLPGPHVLEVTLRPVGDTPIPWYTQVIRSEMGLGGGYIALAQDESPGWYTLTVRDVLSGVSTTARIAIRGFGTG